MSILSMYGFEGRDLDRERIIVFNSVPAYDTTPADTPVNSPSATSIGGSNMGIRCPWYDQSAGPNAVQEPSTEECWFHLQWRVNRNDTVNDGHRMGVGSNANEFITLSYEDNTLRLTLRIAGVVVATAPVWTGSVNQFERYHVHVTGLTAGDEIRVYSNGDLSSPVLTYVLTGGDQTTLAGTGSGKPNEFWLKIASGDVFGRVDDVWAMDPADGVGETNINRLAEAGIRGQQVNGNGAAQEWSGDYTDIDDLPASDVDAISTTSVDQTSRFTKVAIVGSAETVAAVKVMARVTRTDTSAGSNIGVDLFDGVNSDEKASAAPGDGDVHQVFDLAPDGSTWTPAKYDAVDVGFISRT